MNKQKRPHKRSVFLQKIYKMLESQEFQDTISWYDQGPGFIIHNCDKFTSQVLPSFFKHSNFNSFIRQLNMYGFSKKRASKNENYYFHEKFIKNSKQMLGEIQRRAEKKNTKQSYKRLKIQSDFSIQLQSQQEHRKNSPSSSQLDDLKMRFYQIINANQLLLNSHAEIISQILKEVKSLNLERKTSSLIGINLQMIPQNFENSYMNILGQYLNANFQLKTCLLDKGTHQIKDSEKYIQSSAKVETQETLNQYLEGKKCLLIKQGQ